MIYMQIQMKVWVLVGLYLYGSVYAIAVAMTGPSYYHRVDLWLMWVLQIGMHL